MTDERIAELARRSHAMVVLGGGCISLSAAELLALCDAALRARAVAAALVEAGE